MIKATKPEPVVPEIPPVYSYADDIEKIQAMKSVGEVYTRTNKAGEEILVVVTAKDVLTHPMKEGFLDPIVLEFVYFPVRKAARLAGFKTFEGKESDHPVAYIVPGPDVYLSCLGDNIIDITDAWDRGGIPAMVEHTIMVFQTIGSGDDEIESEYESSW